MSISSDCWEAQFRHHGGAPDSTTVVHGGQISSNSKLRQRSRASRKAPTTQLNASTANFRDLVQQFTGFQAVGAGVTLGSHKGPVNLSFGQTGDDIHNNNHPSVMLPFSNGRHFQLRRQPPADNRFPAPAGSTSGDSGFSLPAAELTQIQNLIDEDLNYDLHDLAMDFYSSSENGYFHTI